MLSSSCSSFFFPAVFSFSTRIRFIFRLRDWVFHYSRKSLWMNRESHSLSLSTTETEIERRKGERREKERRRKDTEEGEGEKKRERLQWCEWICEEYTHAYEYRHVLISTILSQSFRLSFLIDRLQLCIVLSSPSVLYLETWIRADTGKRGVLRWDDRRAGEEVGGIGISQRRGWRGK